MNSDTVFFDNVRQVIQNGNYQQALTLLSDVKGEKAERWRSQLRQKMAAQAAIKSSRKNANTRKLLIGVVGMALIAIVLATMLAFRATIQQDMASGIVCTEKHCYDATTGAVIETPDATEAVMRAYNQKIVCDLEATRIAKGKSEVSEACK